jgi:hypothetical protein
MRFIQVLDATVFSGIGMGGFHGWLEFKKGLIVGFEGLDSGFEGFGWTVLKDWMDGFEGLDNVFHGRPDSKGLSLDIGAFSRFFKDLLLYIVNAGLLVVTGKSHYFGNFLLIH